MALALAGAAQDMPGSTASCAELPALRSTDSDRAVSHVFQNGGASPLTLSWIDFAGTRVDMGDIGPGAYRSIRSHVDHAFVLTDPKGRCRAALRLDDVFSGTFVGTSRYRSADVDGWHVLLDRTLDPADRPTRTALATLEKMLRQTESVLPAAALAQVRRTPIFLLAHSGPGGMFHSSPDWLLAHGRTVEMVNAIEISDASVFIDTAKSQPWAVLHELAHSYYFKLSEAERADVEATYRRVMARGLYRAVAHYDGSIVTAYATQNAAEYFAETSEAHFGRNDFFPFTRAELATYDPDGEQLMTRLWR